MTLSFTIFSGQKNYNRAHMLFQVLCGFEPIFYTTHPNEESIKEVKKDVVCFGRGMEVPLSRKYHDQINELHMNKIRRAYKEQELNYN